MPDDAVCRGKCGCTSGSASDAENLYQFSRLHGTRFNQQIELTTKNTFKRRHDRQMIEFVVFNSVFGKWRSQLIDVSCEKPQGIVFF